MLQFFFTLLVGLSVFNLEVNGEITFPSLYEFSQSLDPKVILNWTIHQESSTIAIKVTIKHKVGWVGLGFEPDDSGMTNCDMVIAQFANSSCVIRDYWSVDYDTPELDTLQGGSDSILASRGGKKDHETWFEFIRPLAASDRTDRSLIEKKLYKIVWAFGTGALDYHEEYRGLEYVDLHMGVCVLDCNHNGICKNFYCSCNMGWTGLDCSGESGQYAPFPKVYSHSLVVDPMVTISWREVDISGVPSLAVQVDTNSTGWIAIGFGYESAMRNIDLVVGNLLPVTSFLEPVVVSDFWADPLGIPRLDTSLGGTNNLVARGGQKNGRTWMEFFRPLDSGDEFDEPIMIDGMTKVYWAYGEEKMMPYLDFPNRGSVWVDFFSSGECPNFCSGKGVCVDGACECNASWTGEDCSIPSPFPFPSSVQSAQLSPGFHLSWSYNDTHIALSLVRKAKPGWFGIGFGAIDGMTNSDMIIASISPSGEVLVKDYWSRDFVMPVEDTSFPDGFNSIQSYHGYIQDDSTHVQLIRPLRALDQYDKEIVIGKPVHISYAFGDSLTLKKHKNTDRGVLVINLENGDRHNTLMHYMRVIHGCVMFFSWGVLLLGGALWAHLRKRSPQKICGIPAWFFVHRITQYTGIVLSALGFTLAFFMVKVHFATAYHAQLGVGIMAILLIQALFAFLRPPPEEKGKRSFLRYIFENQHKWTALIVLILSIPTIATGMLEIRAPYVLLDLYLVFIGLVLFLFILRAIYNIVSAVFQARLQIPAVPSSVDSFMEPTPSSPSEESILPKFFLFKKHFLSTNLSPIQKIDIASPYIKSPYNPRKDDNERVPLEASKLDFEKN
eukprot:TRINITY_DN9230_c0_g1_i1.p1 TRINITY_DN9230_c0_g1~~TRINITY_DN9230_c0_g1_i1.p1  ORF type:complete len:837 (+),score=145.72 TRINITY_DN9230_c0_g1_i1:64-2574(+)